MPSDYGHEQTDKELKRLEEKINKEYAQAAKEVQDKFYAHMKDFERKDAKMLEKLNAGEITDKEYQAWRMNQMLTGQRMNALYDNLAKDLANADQIAAGMINDSLPDIYALNMNYSTYKIENLTEIDTNFTLYNKDTVRNLLKEDPRIIPQLTANQAAKIKKDELWNRQHLVSAVTQGILQGEGIPKIATRLKSVAAMDNRAATRNARTYVTAAQNKGRIDSYERAEKLGIETNKKWIATLDDRTRVEHRHLDGVSIPYSDVFKMDGYEIEYPGDPSAEPEMIYNCRCTLVDDIKNWPYNDERNDSKLGDMTYEEWKHAKDKPGKDGSTKQDAEIRAEQEKAKEEKAAEEIKEEKTVETNTVVNGKDLSLTWQRRADEFEFRIEDIINAQGFDGLPKVVNAEEFEKAVKESNFIAQRTYSAVDNETLSAYQESLYNGKWYVDCSVGGCAHGKGMYSAANYDGELSDEIKQEMKDYIGQNENYTSVDAPHIIETFTVDPSAKFLEIPPKVDDDDYVGQIYTNHVIKSLGEKYGVEEKANELVSLNEDKLKNEMLLMQGKITEKEYGDIVTEINDKLWELRHSKELEEVMANYTKIAFRVPDIGEKAALMGYDGLHTHYGTCKNDTIILNRTKLIFKGE